MKPLKYLLAICGILAMAGCRTYQGGTGEQTDYNSGYSITRSPNTVPSQPPATPPVYPNVPPPEGP